MLTQATWSNADDYRTATRQGQNMTQAMSGTVNSPFPRDNERDELLRSISAVQDYIRNPLVGSTGLTVPEATALIDLRAAVNRACERKRSADKP